jgi:hypothetical protein
MPGYQSSGSEALQELAKDAKEAKQKEEQKAVEESEEFAKAKEREAMARRIAAFGDCG